MLLALLVSTIVIGITTKHKNERNILLPISYLVFVSPIIFVFCLLLRDFVLSGLPHSNKLIKLFICFLFSVLLISFVLFIMGLENLNENTDDNLLIISSYSVICAVYLLVLLTFVYPNIF